MLVAGCGPSDGRAAYVVNTIVRSDLVLLRNRPSLTADKYERMALSPYNFFRGTFPLFLRDALDPAQPTSWTRYPLPNVLWLGIGDAHLENFGVLRATDGTLALEPNDLDAADSYPSLWELRRLGASLALATRASNASDPDAQARAITKEAEIVRAAMVGYLDELGRVASGGAQKRWSTSEGATILEDVWERAEEGLSTRSELRELTAVQSGQRRFVRGPIDGDASEILRDLPPSALAALPETLQAYASTLLAPPPLGALTLRDAVQQLGSGIASLPRVRLLLLVDGPSTRDDDDVILELKELCDSPSPGFRAPGVAFDDVPSRVRLASRRLWARVDAEPHWGTATFLGLPVQLRLESEGQQGLRVKRLTGARGTPQALEAMAAIVGARLAAIHGPQLGAGAVTKLFAQDREGFLMEQTQASRSIADGVESDHALFVEALSRLGPTLGADMDPEPVVSTLAPLLDGLSP